MLADIERLTDGLGAEAKSRSLSTENPLTGKPMREIRLSSLEGDFPQIQKISRFESLNLVGTARCVVRRCLIFRQDAGSALEGRCCAAGYCSGMSLPSAVSWGGGRYPLSLPLYPDIDTDEYADPTEIGRRCACDSKYSAPTLLPEAPAFLNRSILVQAMTAGAAIKIAAMASGGFILEEFKNLQVI